LFRSRKYIKNVYILEPFPLYPKEVLSILPEKQIVVKENTALKLEATRDYNDEKLGLKINAGDEYLLKGPVTYQPKIYEKIVKEVTPYIIQSQEALKIKAKQGFTDRFGLFR
jgi:major vault protein